LGSPVGGFDHAVLLCERETGDTVEFWLPKSFLEDYGKSMSHSGDQLKFNSPKGEWIRSIGFWDYWG
jgi:hypothetical protein